MTQHVRGCSKLADVRASLQRSHQEGTAERVERLDAAATRVEEALDKSFPKPDAFARLLESSFLEGGFEIAHANPTGEQMSVKRLLRSMIFTGRVHLLVFISRKELA